MHDEGIGSWVVRRARMTPHTVALVDGDRDTTYAALLDRTTRLAHVLRDLGVARGDRVAYLGYNGTSFVEVLFATARLGAVLLPLNTRLAPGETAWILDDSDPRLLLHSSDFTAQVAQLSRRGTDVVEVDRLEPELEIASTEPVDETVSLDDLLMVQYTSGTSGRPKGVMLSHGNITWNVMNLLVDVDLTSDEVALVAAPLFHTAALNQLLLPTLLKGGTCLLEPAWRPDRALSLIEQRGVTFLFGVTTMYQSLLQHPRWAETDLSSVHVLMSGGAPIPESLLQAYLERGLRLMQGYGLTEASPGVTFLRGEDNLRRVGSAGTACFFTDVRLRGIDDSPPAVGEVGEVQVSGRNVSAGYWRNTEATAGSRTEDGWLRTGDLARADAEGYLTIVDRLKDMIISGGENIYPAEVEAAIYQHSDVAECAVIGVPDAYWGEVGRAVVVPRPGVALTEADVLSHLDGRLARYKIPRSVLVVDELPHNASGKLLKTRVRERFGEPGRHDDPADRP